MWKVFESYLSWRNRRTKVSRMSHVRCSTRENAWAYIIHPICKYSKVYKTISCADDTAAENENPVLPPSVKAIKF